MQKKFKIFFFGVLCFVFILMIYNSQKEKKWSEDEMISISVGINKSLKSAPVAVSWKSGFFLQQGIKADLIMEASAVPLLDKLFSGELDIICAPEHLVAFSALNRGDFRIIATLNRNQSQELIINKDSGIKEIRDFKSIRIGLKEKSSASYFLYRWLLINGINFTDVHLVDMIPSELSKSLAAGNVDAIVTWPPFTAQAKQKLGDKALSFNVHLGRDMYWVLLAKSKWCEKNYKVLERFLSALQSGFELIEKSPEKAMEISSAYFGFPGDRIKEEWGLYDFALKLPRGCVLAM